MRSSYCTSVAITVEATTSSHLHLPATVKAEGAQSVYRAVLSRHSNSLETKMCVYECVTVFYSVIT